MEEEIFLSSFAGEVEGPKAMWGGFTLDVAKRGEVGVALSGVVAVGDDGVVDGAEGVVGDCRFCSDGDSKRQDRRSQGGVAGGRCF